MVQLKKKNIKLKNKIFLNSFIGNFQFFSAPKRRGPKWAALGRSHANV